MKTIAIVGRPNVGKSALFNRLAGRNISIVHDEPGVTRDRINSVCRLAGEDRVFEIVDTGGIGMEPDPDFAEETHFAADVAIATADLLLLVVDGQLGVTPLDAELADQVRRSGKETVLVVNKIDLDRHEMMLGEFSKLGFEWVLGVSAAHARGIGMLVETIGELVDLTGGDEAMDEEEHPPKVAIVGRPNVGKSSLVNAILNDKRTIVSEIAGTTRDAVDIPYEFGGRKFVLVDTAGIRHRSKHNTSVEVFSVMRSENAISRADLNLIVIDATMGVTSQDKKIAGLMQDAKKAAIIVLNKWDLVKPADGEGERELLKQKLAEIRAEMFFLAYAPVVVVSAKDRENLPRLFNMIEKVRQHAQRKVGTGELNRIFALAVQRQPPPIRNGRRFKILYATQVNKPEARPFGRVEFLLFVNDPRKLPDSYESYLAARVREEKEYPGLPMVFKLKGRKPRDRTVLGSGGGSRRNASEAYRAKARRHED
ncbi:MAG: ribosome biogenesis GTPase Der [Chthoniobacterales bacterium]